MKKFLFFLLTLILGIGLLAWIIDFVGLGAIGNAISVFKGWQALIIFLITLLMMIVGAWKWREILKGQKIEIPAKNIFTTYLAGFSIMFLAPVLFWGSEIFRSYLLKEKYSIPWSKGMTSIIIDRIFEWTANLIIIFFGISFFIYKVSYLPLKTSIVFGSIFLIFSIGIIYFYFRIYRKKSIFGSFVKMFFLDKFGKNTLSDIENELFGFFKIRNKSMWMAIVLSFARVLVMWMRNLLLIFFLGGNIGKLMALSVLGFTYVAALLPIPAALGSHEAIQTFVFGSLGLSMPMATVFTMIIRAAEFTLALFGLIFVFTQGLEVVKINFFQSVDKLFKKSNRNESQ